MNDEPRQILSISRRTDIPAFYMPWFMEGVSRGRIKVVNPFNRRIRIVDVTPEKVHTLVFWSKNFGPFLADRYGERLEAMGYHLFFNFTVNSQSRILEPGVPALSQRLDQLRELGRRFGAAAVQWRFDPICHFAAGDQRRGSNMADFEAIATVAGEIGIRTCVTSFMDQYRKIARRTGGKLVFMDPPAAEKAGILMKMQAILKPLGIDLALCCENALFDQLPAETSIKAGACISGRRIMALYGGRVSLRQDAGQRKGAGCGCTVSVDVGSYSLHPCHHNCLYCYASPACDQTASKE
jgi:hypothetical protein